VQRGVRVCKKRQTGQFADDRDIEDPVGFWIALRDALSDLPTGIYSWTICRHGPAVGARAWPLLRPLRTLLGYDNADEYHNLEGKRVNTSYPANWIAESGCPILPCGHHHNGLQWHSLRWMAIHFSL
jgi:hypothetical protein